MNWGIFHYDFAYMPERGKVCINTVDTQPATLNCYTREDLQELAEDYRGICPLYAEAIKLFPKENECEELLQLS